MTINRMVAVMLAVGFGTLILLMAVPRG